MAFINKYTELESLSDGRFRQTAYLSPVAYEDSGVLKAIDSAWVDSGDPQRPPVLFGTTRLRIRVSGLKLAIPFTVLVEPRIVTTFPIRLGMGVC
jgi:hypothetical protein